MSDTQRAVPLLATRDLVLFPGMLGVEAVDSAANDVPFWLVGGGDGVFFGHALLPVIYWMVIDATICSKMVWLASSTA